MSSKKSKNEFRKISQGVFDTSTLNSIEKLRREGKLDTIKGIISTGKEANVYSGTLNEEYIAIKIYAVEASDFKTMDRYIIGDHRFSRWRNKRQLINLWVKKEHDNLLKVQDKEINSPKPSGFEKNVLVMSLIGDGGVPSPKLKDTPPKEPVIAMKKIFDFLRTMYQEAKLVHGDLSEYNILNWREEPYLVDFSTGILKNHPLANQLLARDLRNVSKYFRKLGIKNIKTDEELIRWVKER